MYHKDDIESIKERVEEYLSNIHFDTQTVTGERVSEDYIIRLVTRFAISICSSWWAITEIIDFFRKRKDLKVFIQHEQSTP